MNNRSKERCSGVFCSRKAIQKIWYRPPSTGGELRSIKTGLICRPCWENNVSPRVEVVKHRKVDIYA